MYFDKIADLWFDTLSPGIVSKSRDFMPFIKVDWIFIKNKGHKVNKRFVYILNSVLQL